MESFWSIPAGALIAILAFVVFIPTLIPPERFGSRLRTFFGIVGLLLLAGELVVLKHDQKHAAADRIKQDTEHTQEINKLLAHFTFVEGLLSDDLRVNKQREVHPAAHNSNTLKTRALDLSDEILLFLVNRQMAAGYGQGGFGEGGFGGTDVSAATYQNQTLEMFHAAFGSRVATIREAFASRGMTDAQLDSEFNNPANSFSIRTIAERLAGLAEKLRE